MADKKDQSQTTQDVNPDDSHILPITILRQYIRDLSFENPAAPESLKLNDAPDMEIDIDTQARKIEDPDIPNLYEVVLRVRVVTTISDSPVFLAELDYATLVSIGKDVPENQHHPILFIEVPRLAYPYASQVITNTCLHGGFPPVFLKPVDFHSMYMDRYKEEIEAAQKETDDVEVTKA